MTEVKVALGERSYGITIDEGLLADTGNIVRNLSRAEKAVVITDEHVNEIYGPVLENSLQQAGFAVRRIAIVPGEKSKNLMVLGSVYEQMAEFGLTRSDLVLTLGGGVPGDLGGLAAATFLRGVTLMQLPTSLLAQIDSSVGGKVAVDLPGGKNLVGAFYQPAAVLIDPLLLATLPERFLHDGFAEAIKYGCIKSEELFVKLAAIKDDAGLLAQAGEIIADCCNIKARIVERDEFDNGERMLLNFGHTIGHALEKCTGYERYTHGEAVAIGMLLLTGRTEQLGLTERGTTERLQAILTQFALPLETDVPVELLLEAMTADKKKKGEGITLVYLERIGCGRLLKLPFAQLRHYLEGVV